MFMGKLYKATPLQRFERWRTRKLGGRKGFWQGKEVPMKIFITRWDLEEIMRCTEWANHDPMPMLSRFRGVEIGEMEVFQ